MKTSLDKITFDFDFTKASNLSELESGTILQIKDYKLLDTKYGVVLVMVDNTGELHYTYADVIIGRFRTAINTGVKLNKAVVKFVKVESSTYDEETGEYYTYFDMVRATSEETSKHFEAVREANRIAKENRESEDQEELEEEE